MNPFTPLARLCAVAVLIAPLSSLRASSDAAAIAKELDLIHYVEPVFPDSVRYDGVAEGHVVLAIGRTAAGEPADILVVQTSHRLMADAAVSAVRQWRFRSATGPAALEPRTVRMGFRARGIVIYPFGRDTSQAVETDLRSASMENKVKLPQVQTLAQAPKALNQPMPGYPASLTARKVEGTAAVKFYVDEEGRVRLPHVTEATSPEFAEAVIAAVSQWRYEPPRIGQRAVVAGDQWAFQFKAHN